MNIFYLHNDPKICAQMHCDSHVVKMVLEYTQILSAAHRILDGKSRVKYSNKGRATEIWELNDQREDILYQVTHPNHPSVIWARSATGNYNWLYQLLCETCLEFEYRYDKVHQSKRIGVVGALEQLPNNIPTGEFTDPTQAMPDKYKIPNDAIGAYRAFYVSEKTKLLKWKKREIPDWVQKKI